MRSGQISLVILLGVLILLGFFIVLLSQHQSTSKSLVSKSLIVTERYDSAIGETMQICLAQQLKSSLAVLGFFGGYYLLPDDYLVTDKAVFTYALSNNQIQIRRLDDIAKDIELNLIAALPGCWNKVRELKLPITIDDSGGFANVSIKNDTIEALVSDNTIFKIGKTQTHAKQFMLAIPSHLGAMVAMESEIANMFKQDPYHIDVTLYQNGLFDIGFINYNEQIVVVQLLDWLVPLYGYPYLFQFAVKLS